MTTMLSGLGSLAPMAIPAPPGDGVWNIGPFPLRGYALCIILGIVVAIWIGERRWVARGGRPGDVQDLAIWAVPFGLVGGRLYHVATDWESYFGEGRNPVTALYVWRGGLGIWGAIALGAVGVWIWSRIRGVQILPMLDVLAPAVIVAQAIGRWGNWFNQELYGRPTTLPWGLEVANDSTSPAVNYPPETLFHPTFLYEFLWNLAIFGVLIWAERRFRLGHGRVLALYVMGYTLGRGWIEYLRIDDVQLDDVLGLRFNVWTSIVLFVLALAYFVVSARRHPGREDSLYRPGTGREEAAADELDPAGETDGAEEAEQERGERTGDEPVDEPGDRPGDEESVGASAETTAASEDTEDRPEAR